MSNVFQKIAGGFKRVLPAMAQGAVKTPVAPLLGAIGGAVKSLRELPKDYTGQYGTNQNYAGPGGYNYAKPQGTPTPTVTPPPTGGSGGGTGTGGGTGGGYSSMGGGGTPSPAASNPGNDQFDAYNLLLTDALRRSQGVDSVELLRRRRALQRAAIGRSDEMTPEELRTLSPSQQDAIRNGDIKALQPDIDENEYQIKKAEKITENFEKIFTEARKFGVDYAEKVEAPADVISSYAKLIEADPSNLATILSGVNERTRTKVISSLNPAAFAAAAAKKKSGGGAGGFNFTDTQLAKGAAAAGMTLAAFSSLSNDEKNQYINGQDDSLPLPPAQLATKIVEKFDTLFRSKANAKTKALQIINSGKFTSNGKTYTLTPGQISQMVAAVNSY